MLNRLIGEERAIVSDIAGTTRDVIEELINIDGILFRFIDTAGIRETTEKIESIGIERAKKKIEEARLVICMADSVENLENVRSWAEELQNKHSDKNIITVLNKCDLLNEQTCSDETHLISAKNGDGVESLKKQLAANILGGEDWTNQTIVTSGRHHEALIKTIDALDQVLYALKTEISADLIAMDIRNAMYHLGSITGDISSDELLGNIFSRFCIGK